MADEYTAAKLQQEDDGDKHTSNSSDAKEHVHEHSENASKTNLSRVDSEVAKYASAGRVHISPEENKRLKRLVDRRVLSIMVFTYFLQSLDKGTMSFASIMGIREDAKLENQQVCSPHNTTRGK